MRFSVLLPTRNRLELLRDAIETVRRQDYDDWEIVVSDNCSEEDVAGYVQKLDEPRIRYVRTPRPVSVAENWSNALAQSSGDYFVMLGDDDGLVRGYFSEVDRVLRSFDDPDVLYARAFQFSHPGVKAEYPGGYLQVTGCARFFDGLSRPAQLDRRVARDLVRRSLRFELAFDFNMQHATVKRSTVQAMVGGNPFFRSVFPDYYAMNLLFLRAERIVIDPRPLTIIGISRSSYGYFHANRRADEGMAILAGVNDRGTRVASQLPLDDIKSGWLDAMRELERAVRSDTELLVDEERLHILRAAEHLDTAVAELREVRLRRRLGATMRLYIYAMAASVLPARCRIWLRAMRFRHLPEWSAPMIENRYSSLLDVFADTSASG